MSTNRNLEFVPWPLEIDIGFCRGVILTIALFFSFELWNWILEYFWRFIQPHFSNYGLRNIGAVIGILNIALVYFIVQILGKINVSVLLWHASPSLKQGLKWGFWGICLSIIQSINRWNWEYDLESPGALYVWIATFVTIVDSGVIVPVIEEIIYRGILYATLRKKGRAIAYFVSVFWFVFNHVPSYSNLLFCGIIGLTFHHFVFLILMGIIAAYIYESTGKLILCIIFHGASNTAPLLAPFLNYLINQ